MSDNYKLSDVFNIIPTLDIPLLLTGGKNKKL